MEHFSLKKMAEFRADTDIGLVERAKTGDKLALNQLITNHRDLLTIKANSYRKAPVPFAAIEGEAMIILIKAVNNFTPGSGASFRTFLESHLHGLNRYVASHKNVARIPENKQLLIKKYKDAYDMLRTKLFRIPTMDEMCDELGWSPKDVHQIDEALKQRDLASQDFETQGAASQRAARLHETVEFVYVGLSPIEKAVFDYVTGSHGKPQLSDIKDVAKKLRLTSDQVYKIRSGIAKKIQ